MLVVKAMPEGDVEIDTVGFLRSLCQKVKWAEFRVETFDCDVRYDEVRS